MAVPILEHFVDHALNTPCHLLSADGEQAAVSQQAAWLSRAGSAGGSVGRRGAAKDGPADAAAVHSST